MDAADAYQPGTALPASGGVTAQRGITESGGNQFAVSGAGAKGLFQFMDGTARDMGLRGNDVFDPEKAAQAAAKYLSQLLQANGGDLSKALASYNWGSGTCRSTVWPSCLRKPATTFRRC
jgi:soluble lytic murein transglycosylase-like protein